MRNNKSSLPGLLIKSGCVNEVGPKGIFPQTESWYAIFPRPDGQKKAYVRLAADYDALDVANKVSGTIMFLVINMITLSFSPSLQIGII